MSTQDDMKEKLEHGGESSFSVVISINNKLNATSSSPPKYTIFKVHELLRRENELAYEPEILAIGPYHRGKPRLQVMENLKLRWLKAGLEELGERDASKYVEAMKILEPEARRCYSESTSHVKADDFVEMMLLDCYFIIEFMRRRWLTDDLEDPYFLEEWVIGSFKRDMMLFENQIPLFVLKELFSIIRRPGKDPDHFHEFGTFFLRVSMSLHWSNCMRESSNPNDADHMLGFLHDLLCSLAVGYTNKDPVDGLKTSKNLQQTIKLCEDGFKSILTRSCRRGQLDQRDFLDAHNHILNTESILSAAKLHAAGVQFKRKKDGTSPFEISFKNGVMEIPTFIIDDSTESLYRNLIAYEQYSQNCPGHCVVLHANLMDCLIDSAEDVALLRNRGIVVNALGDDEAVSTLFNKLVTHVTVSNGDSKVHSELFKQVNAYCTKRRHKWMAKLRRDYFNNPWALISFFAALFLLVLTLIQTVFSILGGL